MDRYPRDPLLPDERGGQALLRHVRRPGPKPQTLIIAGLGVISALMLGASLFNLMPDSGPESKIKALLITASGGLVAYGVNHFSIEKGAALAAIGFRYIGVLCVAAMMAVGTAMGISTYSGVVLPAVVERVLQVNATELTSFVGAQNRVHLSAAQAGSALKVVEAGQSQNAACEVTSSCLSNRGEGGRGPVAIALETLSRKAAAIAKQFDAGQATAQQALATANALIGDYQKVLDRTDINAWQKHSELLKLHGRIEQQANALREAIPLPLVRAYVKELRDGVTIPDRPDAARRVNALLSEYAESLSAVLASLGEDDLSFPRFPSRPGVSDTLRFIGEFVSIAAIIFVAECILPLVLFAIQLARLTFRIEEAENDRRGPPPPSGPPAPPSRPSLPPANRDDFDGLIKLPPPDEKNGQRQRRRRRHHRRPS